MSKKSWISFVHERACWFCGSQWPFSWFAAIAFQMHVGVFKAKALHNERENLVIGLGCLSVLKAQTPMALTTFL